MWTQRLFSKDSLNQDINEHFSEQTIHYMLNGDLFSAGTKGSQMFIQNQLSNEHCLDLLGKTPCGQVKLDKNQFVLFFSHGEIGLFDSDNCKYEVWASSLCLNFSTDNWITGVYKYIKGDRYVYFVDGKNPIRYINIDKPFPKTYNDCRKCDEVIIDELDCERLKLHKNIDIPNIKLLQTSGNIPNGSYQVAIRFSDNKIGISEYYIYTDVLKLHSNNNQKFGIKIEFDCFNTAYEQYEVLLIANRADRGTVAQSIGFYDINTRQIIINDLDSNRYIPVDNTVLFEVKPYYQSANHITTNNERLILGNVETRIPLNYQPQAFSIRSKWISGKVKAKNAYKYKSYMRDEVYAHYIRWIFKDGERSNWFHIPPHDLDLHYQDGQVNMLDKWDDCYEDKKYWEVYNTATSKPFQKVITQPECKKYTITSNHPCIYFYAKRSINDPVPCFKWTDCIGVDHQQVMEVLSAIVKVGSVNAFSNTNCTSPYPNYSSLFGPYDDGTISGNKHGMYQRNLYEGFRVTYKDCDGVQNSVYVPQPDTSKQTPVVFEFCGLADYTVEVDNGGGYNVSEAPCEEVITDCDDFLPNYEGTFSYWESSLSYPNSEEFGSKKCTPIKYHKFPDNKINPHHEYSSIEGKPCEYDEYVNILTIEFSNIEYPKCNGEFVKDILGYEIGVADRSSNKSIIHKGLLYNMREEPLEDCTTGLYPNYPFNDLTEDCFIGSKWTYSPANITTDVDNHGEVPHEGLTGVKFDTYTYISPNINYVKNDAGSELVVYEESVGYLEGSFQSTDEMPRFSIYSALMFFIISLITILAAGTGVLSGLGSNLVVDVVNFIQELYNIFKGFTNPLQHALNSYATSNYYKPTFERVVAGNKRRRIDLFQYLIPGKVKVGNLKINNYERESSLLIKVNENLLPPINKDLSRFTKPMLSCDNTFSTCTTTYNGEKVQTSSYYVGIKNYVPNQYGSIYDPIVTQVSNVLKGSSSGIVFGGDIYITKHKQIRKLPFFTSLPLGLPDDTYFELSNKPNVGIPRFHVDNEPQNIITETLMALPLISNIATIGSLFSASNKYQRFHFDKTISTRRILCNDDPEDCMSFEFVKGYGNGLDTIISNTFGNTGKSALQVQGHFYTHCIGVVEYWCESEFIGDYREISQIPQSNIERGKEEIIKYSTIQYPELFLYDLSMLSKPSFKPTPVSNTKKCEERFIDNFKIPFSLKDDIESGVDNWLIFKPLNYHQFTPSDGKLTTIHAIDNYNLLFAFENAIYITQSDDGLITANGSSAYLGSGSIFERRMKRLSDEATGYCGSVDKYSFSNSRYGTVWVDRLRKRVFLYNGKLQDITKGLEAWFNVYLSDNKVNYYRDSVITIFDNFTRNYYITSKESNKEFTVSFKPDLDSWVSFHSFVPYMYLQLPNNIMSVEPNTSSIWKHNKLYDYQSYYGRFYKFDVGYTLTDKFKKLSLNNIEIYSQIFKELGYNFNQYESNKFFNKMCAYNSHVSTGIQELFFRQPNTIYQQVRGNESEVTEIDSHRYRINDFKNYANGTTLVHNSGPMDYTLVNYDPTIAPTLQGNINGDYINLHLINDLHNLKFLMKLGLHNSEQIKQ